MEIQTVTITVSNLEASTAFYTDLLGFAPGDYYEPTNWQPFRFGEQLFGLREMSGFARTPSFDISNFETDDVDTLWESVRDRSEIVEPLGPTPWGSYRFVIRDPDGYQLAFVAK